MTTPADLGWGVPPFGRALLAEVHCSQANPAKPLPMFVRREVAPLFNELVVRMERVAVQHGLGTNFMTSSGGYNNRPMRGKEEKFRATGNIAYLSRHSWGLAGDFRAGSNPGYSNKRTDFPMETRSVAESVGLSWGGTWKSPYDPMHFEFLGTPHDAARWVARLQMETSTRELLKGIDVTPEQFELLNGKLDAILYQMGYDVNAGKWGTFEALDGSKRKLTQLDLIRETHRELMQKFTGRTVATDTMLGHVLNIARSLHL